jgi:peptidoglycan/LPS O-acetylase OafA/YrhL
VIAIKTAVFDGKDSRKSTEEDTVTTMNASQVLYNIAEAIPLFLWFGLIVCGISKNVDQSSPFEPRQAQALRGICAVEIMIGHIGLATGSSVLYANRKAGILFVGIFFLLSGYGVAYSAEHKKDYLKGFLLNRAVRILVPVYVTKILILLLNWIVTRYFGLTFSLTAGQFFFAFNWYVWEQLFFYLLYWFACKFVPKQTEVFVLLGSLALTAAAFVCGLDNPWYGSSLCFALGLFYYKFCKRHSVLRFTGRCCFVTAASAILLAISMAAFFVLGNDSVIGNPVARNVASVSFCVLTILLLYRFRTVNAVSGFLGQCAYEIFLIHPSILSLLKTLSVTSTLATEFVTIALTIPLAYLAHRAVRKVFSKAQS